METAGTKPNRNATKNNNTQMAKQLNTYKIVILIPSLDHFIEEKKLLERFVDYFGKKICFEIRAVSPYNIIALILRGERD
jgi:hypothetical protein